MKIETASCQGCHITDEDTIHEAGARVWVPRAKLRDLMATAKAQDGRTWWQGMVLTTRDLLDLEAAMADPTRPEQINAARSSACPACGGQIRPGQTLHRRGGRWVCGGCSG